MMNGPPTLARNGLTHGADAYHELLSRTRDLPAQDRAAREDWYIGLELPNKQGILFEFDVLLKATACFANPRNHPGPPRRTPVVAHDFRTSAILFRDGAQHAVDLCRVLLGHRDRTFVFHRYLETVLPEDNVRARLAGEGRGRDRCPVRRGRHVPVTPLPRARGERRGLRRPGSRRARWRSA